MLKISTISRDNSHLNLVSLIARNVERDINASGGIGGHKIKILVGSQEEIGISSLTSVPEDDAEKFSEYCINNQADIYISEAVSRLVRFKPEFVRSNNSLFLGPKEKAVNFKASNFIDIYKELFDNSESFAFVAKSINPPSAFYIQYSRFSDDKTINRYKEIISEVFEGPVTFFSFSSEEEDNIYEKSKNDFEYSPDEVFSEKLFAKLEDLSPKSLIGINSPICGPIVKYIHKNFPEKNFHIFSSIDTEDEGVIWTDKNYLSIDNLKRTTQLIKDEKLDNNFWEIEYYFDYLDFLYCLQYLYKNRQDKELEKATLLKSLPEELSRLDGVKDIFIQLGNTYSFVQNTFASKSTRVCQNAYLSEINSIRPIMFECQPSSDSEVIDVFYSYVDLLRVENIDVSEGVWVGLFELEINSVFENPISYLRFNNKSTINDLWDVTEIRNQFVGNRYQVKYRITGAFDFEPEIVDFPFDNQKLQIEISLEQSAPNSILQPPIQELVDQDFELKGWKFISAETGVLRSKNFDRLGSNLQTSVSIQEKNIVQWTIQRQNIIPALRSFVPLFVLIFLSWYSSFYNVDDAKSAVSLNTTVFLAGVALYFSAEKPKGAKFTFIDRLFIYFYAAIGTFILSEFTVLLGEKWYNLAHLIWSVAIPSFLGIVMASLCHKIMKTR